MSIVVISAKGQVVIPAPLRKKKGLRPDAQVLVTLAGDNRLTIEPVPDDPIEALRGILKGGPSLTSALLRNRKKDRHREDEKKARLLRHSSMGSGRTWRSGLRKFAHRGQANA